MEWRRREDWGARPPKAPYRSLNPDRVRSVYIHHTTGAARPDSVGWLQSIQRFHQKDRGWNDIAYCWLVDAAGVIWEGRGNVVGGHTKGHNSTSLGIAFLGDGGKPVPPAALRSIKYLVDNLARTFPIEHVGGHRDVGRTACPGEWLYAWVVAGMPVEDPEPLPEPVGPAPQPLPEPVELMPEPPAVSPAPRPRRSPIPDLREGWKARLRRFR